MQPCSRRVCCPTLNTSPFGRDGAQWRVLVGSGCNKAMAPPPRPRRWRESARSRLARATRLSSALAGLYPDARISLDFNTPWQCLVATILSAQCTDERVNRVTPELYRRLPEVPAMADARLEEIERLIQSTGFYRQKARALQAAAR